MKIFKYKMFHDSRQLIQLPEGFRILSVQTQREQACLWVLVNGKETKRVMHELLTFSTGEEIQINQDDYEFLGSLQYGNGLLVFHTFISRKAVSS